MFNNCNDLNATMIMMLWKVFLISFSFVLPPHQSCVFEECGSILSPILERTLSSDSALPERGPLWKC